MLMKYKFILRDAAMMAAPLPFCRGIETLTAIGIGSIASSLIGGGFSALSTAAQNEANASSVANTNAMNLQIARETNAANLRAIDENNRLQLELQNRMNNYNSLSEQLKRGAQAGVNPNTVLGGVGGNLQTTLPHTDAPNFIAPLMQAFDKYRNPAADFTSTFESLSQGLSKVMGSSVSAAKDISEVDINEITKQWQDKLYDMKIKLDDSQMQKFMSAVKVDYATVKNINESVNYVRALAQSVGLDNYDKTMRNVFSYDFHKFGVEQLQANVGYSKTMANVAMVMLPYQVGLLGAQSGYYKNLGQYYNDLSSLTPLQRNILTWQGNLLQASSFREWNNYSFDLENNIYQLSASKAFAKTAWENYSGSVWNNTWTHRIIDSFGTILGAGASAASMYYMGQLGVGQGFRNSQLRAPMGKIGF